MDRTLHQLGLRTLRRNGAASPSHLLDLRYLNRSALQAAMEDILKSIDDWLYAQRPAYHRLLRPGLTLDTLTAFLKSTRYGVDGKRMEQDVAGQRLQVGRPVILSSDGKMLDPRYRRVLLPDTIILVPPVEQPLNELELEDDPRNRTPE